MHAIVISRAGGPDVLEYQEEPDPTPAAGQALVAVEAIGVNYRDVYEREGIGSYANAAPPLIAGVEGAGMVVAVGDDAADVAVGDRVAWVSGPGSYAEWVAVDARKLVPVPDGVSFELAAAALLQGITAQYLSSSTYPVQAGDWVVVHAAAGGVGQLLTQMVKLRGGHVLATASTDEKADLAREAGADEVVRYEGFAERAHELTDGQGVAAVYDGVGLSTFLDGLKTLRPRGVMVLFGSSSGAPDPLDLARLGSGSLYVTRPSLGHYTRTRGELLDRAGEVFAWIGEGRLSVRIGQVYPLDQARRAHEDLEGRHSTGKLLLRP
jgi:NADPH2:quinone reductase